MPNEKETNHPVGHAAEEERGPIGVGSEATEGIHNVDMKGAHMLKPKSSNRATPDRIRIEWCAAPGVTPRQP